MYENDDEKIHYEHVGIINPIVLTDVNLLPKDYAKDFEGYVNSSVTLFNLDLKNTLKKVFKMNLDRSIDYSDDCEFEKFLKDFDYYILAKKAYDACKTDRFIRMYIDDPIIIKSQSNYYDVYSFGKKTDIGLDDIEEIDDMMIDSIMKIVGWGNPSILYIFNLNIWNPNIPLNIYNNSNKGGEDKQNE